MVSRFSLRNGIHEVSIILSMQGQDLGSTHAQNHGPYPGLDGLRSMVLSEIYTVLNMNEVNAKPDFTIQSQYSYTLQSTSTSTEYNRSSH